MIIVRTPLRISFVGGGSDIASFYRNNGGGAVLSTSIGKYLYLCLNKYFDDKSLKLSYGETVENVQAVQNLNHELTKQTLRAVAQTLGIHNKESFGLGLDINSISDIPSKGSGLGSSSSFTVALLHALYHYHQKQINKEILAAQSSHIEIDLCKSPIGKQDQYAAAYGGINVIEFLPNDEVVVSPVALSQEKKDELQGDLLLFYTGILRSANGILSEQTKNLGEQVDKMAGMKKMVALVYQLKKEFENDSITHFGELLHENRILKKQMAGGISNPQIDERYETALHAGATGGKLLGAGGGGFLMFYAPRHQHSNIKNALHDLKYVPFGFDNGGSQVILDDKSS